MKKKIVKSLITMILAIILSLQWVIDSQNIIMIILGFLNSYFISYILVEVFANIGKSEVNKEKFTRNLSISCLLWAITFLILNTIEYGTVVKLLNISAIFVIGTFIYELVCSRRKEKKEIDIIRFGYMWIVFLLLIPIVLILVIKGY